MKHLFVVHSNITYLAALGVICKENLPLENVVIISDTYLRDTPVKCHFIDIKKTLSQVWRYPRKVLSPFKYTNKLIFDLTGDQPFELYITALFHLQRICMANPNRRGFHFIEEGLSNYRETIPLKLSISFINADRPLGKGAFWLFLSDILLLMKGYSSRIQSLPFLYNAYFNTENVRFYAFDRNAFAGVENKTIMDLPLVAKRFNFAKRHNFNNTHIWIGTNVVRDKVQTLQQYIAGIENGVIKTLKNIGVNRISLKFHPAECDASRNATIGIFNKYGVETVILPDDTIMEIELLGSENTIVWGVDSSLMFYASKMNVKCYSIVNQLSNYNIHDVPAFWSVVEKIECYDTAKKNTKLSI